MHLASSIAVKLQHSTLIVWLGTNSSGSLYREVYRAGESEHKREDECQRLKRKELYLKFKTL